MTDCGGVFARRHASRNSLGIAGVAMTDVAVLERKLEEQIQHNELVVRENDLFELYLKHNQAVRGIVTLCCPVGGVAVVKPVLWGMLQAGD